MADPLETSSGDKKPAAATVPKNKPNVSRVLVIGAGMSGMAVSNELRARGYEVLVVEARQRVGGRLKGEELLLSSSKSQRSSNEKSNGENGSVATKKECVNVDLGGALIHGILENPVYDLVSNQFGFPVQAVQETLLLTGTGWPVDPKEDEKVSVLFNECLDETFRRIHRTAAKNEETNGVATGEARTLDAEETRKGTTSTNTPPTHQLSSSSPPPSLPPSFGELFEKVCAERNVNSQSALFQWHQANLEVSCGASFPNLGWYWNEDEPYGFDGEHVAVNSSWKAVCEALAEPLDIVYDAQVIRIQIVHPPENDFASVEEGEPREEEEEEEAPPSPPKKLKVKTTVARPSRHSTSTVATLPVRQSRRIRGEDASARRSPRNNKGAGINLFTIDHSVVQVLRSSSKRHRRRCAKPSSSPDDKKKNQTVVQVTLASGTTLQADAVVCTLPLGILKRGDDVVFDPPLPVAKQQAIDRLGTGLLNKCALTFPKQFWQDSDFLGLADDAHSYLVLNAAKYTGKPVLLFMYGGDFAMEIEAWTDAEIVEDCLAVLRRICGHQLVTMPLDYHVTRWGKEQYSHMAFTYIPPGVDGFLELQAMSRPIYDHTGTIPVLMFAGEHTTPYHPSTIHGAFLSGIREAYRLDCILEPAANDYLEFSEEHIYQKTFHVKRKFRGSTVSVAAEKAKSSSKPSTTRTQAQHRRRGAAGVMKLRRRPKTVLKQETSTTEQKNSMASPVPKDRGGSPARRSQRSTVTANLPNGNSYPAVFSTAAVGEQMVSGEPVRDKQALEDRVLLRSLESYGQNIDYISAVALPVHGSYEAKPDHQIERRCQRLRQVQRKKKQSRRKWNASTWKAWIADTVEPLNAEVGRGAKQSEKAQKNGTASLADEKMSVKTPTERKSRSLTL